MNNMVIFIAYYDPDQYTLLLKCANDRNKLDDKWEDWLLNFIKAKSILEKDFTVEDFHINVEEMNNYFKQRKLKNDSANRSRYTRKKGMESYKTRNNN